MAADALRICLLTYRGNPRSGGQGIYARLLSKALVELGHRVDVWSGQPYPELVPQVRLVRVPSLDLWNEDAFFRTPSLCELSDPINLREWALTRTGSFAEPLTFSRRVARRFRHRAQPVYDIVHDNQCLGPGLLELQTRLPVVATIHHPVTVDRRIAFENAGDRLKRFGLRRWYGFLSTQLKVARRLDRVLTVSRAAGTDIAREYGIAPTNLRVVGNGINLDVFHPTQDGPNGGARKPHQLITTLSADTPLKGFAHLLRALSLLRRRFADVGLTVIGSPSGDSETSSQIARMGLRSCVRFTGYVAAEDIARHYAESSVAVVPSLYEGFGFPAGEAMACQVPVVSTTGGALPEVVGAHGRTGLLVPPGDAEALASAIASLLSDPALARRIGQAGRDRVMSEFSWQKAAERTVEAYREVIEEQQRGVAC